MSLPLIRRSVPSILFCGSRSISTTTNLNWIQRQTKLRVVDNSTLGKTAMINGKPPMVIDVYKRAKRWTEGRRGQLGDKVLVSIMGELRKGYIVGQKTYHKHVIPMIPRMDSNNVVLLDENDNPLGTRILVPIPYALRGKKDFAKILAIATKFI